MKPIPRRLRKSRQSPALLPDLDEGFQRLARPRGRTFLPAAGFAFLGEARSWTHRFVQWNNHEHLHSSLRFVTPAQKHDGEDAAILARRVEVERAAKARHADRRNGRGTRNWSPVRSTTLNSASPASLESIAKRAA